MFLPDGTSETVTVRHAIAAGGAVTATLRDDAGDKFEIVA